MKAWPNFGARGHQQRPLRIDYPNAWYHVMNRARRGEELFEEKADYQQFIDLLQETADLFHVNVVAFCLMPTHYHHVGSEPVFCSPRH